MTSSPENTALARLLRPLSRGLSVELASALAQLRADDETQARYDELAARCSQGLLTSGDQSELDALVEANTLLGILKAEAELSMVQHQAA